MYSKTKSEPSRAVIARNVKALREHHDLSQAALAAKAGIGQRTVSNMENPDTDTTPTTDRVEAVARVFGLELYQITMPLPLDLLLDIGGISRVVDAYAHAPPARRITVEQVALIAVDRPQ